MVTKKYTYGLGRRKSATASARLYKGKGDIKINDKPALEYLSNNKTYLAEITDPLALAEKQKEYEEAERLYLQIIEKFPESFMADAALMQASLLEQNQLKNKELAKQHYEQLIDNYPTSIYTAQAKKNYRKL